MSSIEQAIVLATTKHAGQKDKSGLPYILHPLTVMQSVKDMNAKIVAVLHDVLEDTDTTELELYNLGFSNEIVEAVLALTKHKGESRMDAAKRTGLNKLATIVKLADVEHNMDLKRLSVIKQKDIDRVQEYKMVKIYLENALNTFN